MPQLPEPYDVLLGLNAHFELVTSRGILLSEPEFTVVEFAASLARWLRDGLPQNHDFAFESVEAEESGLVWFRRVDDGWRVGSVWQSIPDPEPKSLEEIRQAAEAFSRALLEDAQRQFGLDLTPYVEPQARR